MAQQDLIAAIVREVLLEIGGNGKPATAVDGAPKPGVARNGADGAGRAGLDPIRDYPLAKKRPDLVKTPTGKSLDAVTLDAAMKGEVTFADLQITAQVLEYQAQIAEGAGRPQIARNLRRAAEMTKISDERVLEMYNALRPNRSTKAELLAIADELDQKYAAKVCAAHVREAAEVYEKRGRLRQA